MKLDFDEMSPFSNEKTVLLEADEKTNLESRICIASGYTTRDEWKIGSDVVADYHERMTELMRDTKYEDDELGTVWYLSSMSTPAALLYPNGASANQWKWEVSPIEYLVGEERAKYPVPGKEGEYYTSRVATDKAVNFDKSDFRSALEHFYALVNEYYGSN